MRQNIQRLPEHTEIQKERALDVAYALIAREAAKDAYIAASQHFKQDVDPSLVETLHYANQDRDRALSEFALSILKGD